MGCTNQSYIRVETDENKQGVVHTVVEKYNEPITIENYVELEEPTIEKHQNKKEVEALPSFGENGINRLHLIGVHFLVDAYSGYSD